MCSSTRGPAMAPSLVTWPTSTTAMPWVFAKRTSWAAHSRNCETEPGADSSASVCSVCTESITTRPGRWCLDLLDDRIDRRFGQHRQIQPRQAKTLGAQVNLRQRFLAGHIQRAKTTLDRGQAPAAAAWICRCPGRRRSARPSRAQCRRRARDPSRRGPRKLVAFRWRRSRPVVARANRRLQRRRAAALRLPIPPGCSIRRNHRTDRPTWQTARRRSDRCKRFLFWPCRLAILGMERLFRNRVLCCGN